jgi:hypothetical protein
MKLKRLILPVIIVGLFLIVNSAMTKKQKKILFERARIKAEYPELGYRESIDDTVNQVLHPFAALAPYYKESPNRVHVNLVRSGNRTIHVGKSCTSTMPNTIIQPGARLLKAEAVDSIWVIPITGVRHQFCLVDFDGQPLDRTTR